MSASIKHNFAEVHAALDQFFATIPQCAAALHRVDTQEDLEAVQAMEDQADLLVKEAFFEATKMINPHDKCMLVTPWDIARASGYDLTAHFPNAETPAERSAKIGSQRGFDIRRIEGWKK